MTQSKKIAFLISTLAGGGAQRFVSNLATYYANNGHDVHLFLHKNEVAYQLPENVSIHTLIKPRNKPVFKTLYKFLQGRKFRKLIEQQSERKPFDLIISTMFGSNLVARYSGIKGIVYRISNNLDHRLRKGTFRYPLKQIWMRYLLKDQAIVVLNKEMKQHVIERLNISPDTISIIPQAFDFNYLREMANLDDHNLPEQPYILHIGRIQSQKRHDVLLKAYKIANIPHKLVLLGQGRTRSTQKLKDIIDELELRDRVVQPGFQDNPYPWIKHASLVVISSDYEGLSNVLIEALVLGTPVVSTAHISGPRDVMTGELSEFLSEIGAPQALGENIHKALQHYPEIPQDCYEQFNVEHIARQYLEKFSKR